MIDRRNFCIALGAVGTSGFMGLTNFALAQSGAPVRGGTLVAVTGLVEPQAFFVPSGGGGANWLPFSKILERLVRINSDATFSPVMATAWSASEDGREFTLTLRPNMTWHDGAPVTAQDLVFSIKDYWLPISGGIVLTALEGAEAKDDHTVVVKFSAPTPEFYFLSFLASPYAHLLPRHIYEGGDILTNPVNNAPIGTGPWKLKEWVRGSHIEYARNENYWDPEQPYLDQLIIRYLRDPGARSAALEAGEAQLGVFGPLSPADTKRIADSGTLDVTSSGYENGNVSVNMELNVRGEILKSQEVRQALLHAIDRQFIVDTVYFGFAKPAISPIFSSNKNYFTTDVPMFEFDPALAASKLDSLGYPKKADGTRFGVRLLAAGWFAPNGNVGAYVKQALEDIGIAVDLTVPDSATSRMRIYTDYDFDIAITNSTIPFEPVPQITRYLSTDGIRPGVTFTNATGHSNPEMDELIARMKTEIDPARRKTLVTEFARMAAAAAAFVPLAELETLNVANKRVKNHSNSGYFIAETWGDIWLEPM